MVPKPIILRYHFGNFVFNIHNSYRYSSEQLLLVRIDSTRCKKTFVATDVLSVCLSVYLC